MKNHLTGSWKNLLAPEFEKSYFIELDSFVKKAYDSEDIFPPKDSIFEALNTTPFEDIKVLLLGQDPYHNFGQAHGFAFSVMPGQKIPPSLINIYKELNSDIGCSIPEHGYLKKWADQGVLLLNTVLTVKAHEANSHQNKGWETFTDAIIREVNSIDRPIVILLWGKPAQKKNKMLDNPKHLILTAPHPSPLSAYRGFLGCRHFSKANAYLIENNISPIDWCIS